MMSRHVRGWLAVLAPCGHVVAVVADRQPPPTRPSDRDDRAAAKRYAHRLRAAGYRHETRIREAVDTDRPGPVDGCPVCPEATVVPGPNPALWTIRGADPDPAPARNATAPGLWEVV